MPGRYIQVTFDQFDKLGHSFIYSFLLLSILVTADMQAKSSWMILNWGFVI